MLLLLQVLDLLLVMGAALRGVLGGDESGHIHEDLGGLLLATELPQTQDQVEVVVQVLTSLPVLDHLTALLHNISNVRPGTHLIVASVLNDDRQFLWREAEGKGFLNPDERALSSQRRTFNSVTL